METVYSFKIYWLHKLGGICPTHMLAKEELKINPAHFLCLLWGCAKYDIAQPFSPYEILSWQYILLSVLSYLHDVTPK